MKWHPLFLVVSVCPVYFCQSCSAVIAGPRVDIVIGEKAPALERLAADELSSQLKRVYEADVKIGSTAPADAPHVIFVGSPDTNASMKPFADSWPSGDKKLTDQGHLLRSVTHNNKPALLIGGGSPVATYLGRRRVRTSAGHSVDAVRRSRSGQSAGVQARWN